MAELGPPCVDVHSSFLIAVREFPGEGRLEDELDGKLRYWIPTRT